MSHISESSTVVIAGDVLARELDSEFVLLNLQDGIYYGLEGVGGEVWKLVQRPVTIDEILRTIVAEYDVEPERCRQDILTLVADLAARGLVEIRDNQ